MNACKLKISGIDSEKQMQSILSAFADLENKAEPHKVSTLILHECV